MKYLNYLLDKGSQQIKRSTLQKIGKTATFRLNINNIEE